MDSIDTLVRLSIETKQQMNQIEIKDRGKQREATAKRKLKSVRGIKMRYLMTGICCTIRRKIMDYINMYGWTVVRPPSFSSTNPTPATSNSTP
jgi:hypothetical protein